MERELEEVSPTDPGNDETVTGHREPAQSAERINSIDSRDERIYSIIEDTAAAASQPDSVPAPAVYQPGLLGYYEGLVTSPNEEPQRPSAHRLSVYDKISLRRLSGNTAETLLKTPYLKRAKSAPIRRFPNSI